MSKTKLVTLLFMALIGIGILGVLFGSVPLLLSEVWAALTGNGQEAHRDIVVNLRLPRILIAGFVGGGLGVAGATFQALLRNPLAEPYILGVSGGASFGAVLVLSTGLAVTSSWTLPLAAFAGALLAIFLVFRIAISTGGAMDVRILLLSGVVIAAFFSACFLASASERALRLASFSACSRSWRATRVSKRSLARSLLILSALACLISPLLWR